LSSERPVALLPAQRGGLERGRCLPWELHDSGGQPGPGAWPSCRRAEQAPQAKSSS